MHHIKPSIGVWDLTTRWNIMGLNVQKLGNKIGEFADAASGLYIYAFIFILP
jgi:hypothetical protein